MGIFNKKEKTEQSNKPISDKKNEKLSKRLELLEVENKGFSGITAKLELIIEALKVENAKLTARVIQLELMHEKQKEGDAKFHQATKKQIEARE